jgi:DNA-binding MarR family transcriptional regulator
MGYISLRQRAEEDHGGEGLSEERIAQIRQLTERPVVIRILDVLRKRYSLTQQEIAGSLYMSGSAVHYYLKKLLEVGLVRLDRTRAGPKGITEKLYVANRRMWEEFFDTPAAEGDLEYYLKYTIAWAQERHREGLELIRRSPQPPSFVSGSFTVNAPEEEIIRLKHELEATLQGFFEKYGKGKPGEKANYAVTFALLPSTDDGVNDSMNTLEFEPGSC